MARADDPSTYALLGRHLAGQPAQVVEVRLTFAAIETLIGSWLPDAARTRGWWANSADGQSRARAWLDAGWRVTRVTPGQMWTVTFARADMAAQPLAPRRRRAPTNGGG